MNKMIKKLLCISAVGAMTVMGFAGCGSSEGGAAATSGNEQAETSVSAGEKDGLSFAGDIVVQELGVLNTLPAGVNVFAGNWKKFSRFGIIDLKSMYREAEKIFEEYGLMKVLLNGDCETMMIESRKMLEIARALSDDPDILAGLAMEGWEIRPNDSGEGAYPGRNRTWPGAALHLGTFYRDEKYFTVLGRLA